MPEHVVYFNIKIHWALNIIETQRDIEFYPIVDRVQIFSGEDARTTDRMLIIKNDFADIIFNDNTEYDTLIVIKKEQESGSMIIKPTYVRINLKLKIMEVIFNG
jgi:hypothetical protein